MDEIQINQVEEPLDKNVRPRSPEAQATTRTTTTEAKGAPVSLPPPPLLPSSPMNLSRIILPLWWITMAMALLPTLQQLTELYDSSLSFSSSFSFSLGRWYWLWLDDEGFSTNNNTWMLAIWLWMAYLTGHVCSIPHIVHL